MKDTFSPEIIYDVFARNGFPVARIDHFDRGDYAEIRTELNYPGPLTVSQLQEITTKLKLIEESEDIEIRIVNVDMIHKSLRVNIFIRE